MTTPEAASASSPFPVNSEADGRAKTRHSKETAIENQVGLATKTVAES